MYGRHSNNSFSIDMTDKNRSENAILDNFEANNIRFLIMSLKNLSFHL